MCSAISLIFFLLLCANAQAYSFASGSYTGNATDNRNIVISSTTSPAVTDFQPDAVFIKCDGTGLELVWSTRDIVATLGDAAFTPRLAAAAASNFVQSFSSTGFQIGSDNSVNNNGSTCYYTAIASTSGDVAVGHYTTNGTDDRNIGIAATSLGAVADFQPEFVMVEVGGQLGVWATGAMGSVACFIDSPACGSNSIQGVNASGFQVGTDIQTNGSSGDNAFYLAIKATSGSTNASSFTGNATDNRAISVGFQPEMVLIKGNSASRNAGWRFKDLVGDLGLSSDGASSADRIQQFSASGFEVGTSLSVNENTVTMYWYAIKGAATTTRRFAAPIVMQ